VTKLGYDRSPGANRWRGPEGRPLRLAHLTTVDMSLYLLLMTELRVDMAAGLDTIGISAPGPYVGQIVAEGVQHVALSDLTRSWDPRRDLAAARALARQLRDLRLDILHTHNPKTGVLGRVAGRLAGVPVIVNTCHGLWASRDDSLPRRSLVYGAEALSARFSDAELFQNAADAATLRWAIRPRRVQVVGNGVDLDRFRYDAEGRIRVRRELGLGDGELLVGAVGRRVAEKGVAEFSAAATTLGHRARFVWIGPEDRAKSDAVTEAPGLHFISERFDMPAVYSALDLFVLPSYREGFSRSAMEAAACGRPMILSDIRGCREIGTHEAELLLVPPRDSAALTAAVERLLSDSSLRVSLGEAVQARAREAFDQVAVANMSLATYAAVARRKQLGWQEDSPA
jgi:glycosyltransferase involved in cell wall biosynthesis